MAELVYTESEVDELIYAINNRVGNLKSDNETLTRNVDRLQDDVRDLLNRIQALEGK